MGGMEVGSVWGHGSYVAPDWTTDLLHRETVFILNDWARAEAGRSYLELEPVGNAGKSEGGRAYAGVDDWRAIEAYRATDQGAGWRMTRDLRAIAMATLACALRGLGTAGGSLGWPGETTSSLAHCRNCRLW